MKEKLKQILFKYQPKIGDTTYGLGYEAMKKLVDEILNEVVKVVSTHTEHDGGYCDTGEDMGWACRSECMELAIKRLKNDEH